MVGPENYKSNLFIYAYAFLHIQTLFDSTQNCIIILRVVHYELLSKSSSLKSFSDRAHIYCDSRPIVVF
jgi:hypothetical protein